MAAVKATVLAGGFTFLGFALMKYLSPNSEEMMKRIPNDLSQERMEEIKKQNEKVFATMQKAIKSNDPIWKVPSFDEPANTKK